MILSGKAVKYIGIMVLTPKILILMLQNQQVKRLRIKI